MRLVWVPALPGALDCERGEEHDSQKYHCIISCCRRQESVLYHFVMIKYITLVKYVLEKLVVCCIFCRFQGGQFDL